MKADARKRWLVLGGVALIAWAGAVLLRGTTLVQGIELAIYDAGIRFRASDQPTEAYDKIALVTFDDEMTNHPDWKEYPIPDKTLGATLKRIVHLGAVAVGVDFFRGTPVPGESSPAIKEVDRVESLDEVLIENANIVMIKDPEASYDEQEAPPALVDPDSGEFNPLQVATCDVVPDEGIARVVRRGFLAADSDGQAIYSLGLLTSLHYLNQTHGWALERIPEDLDLPVREYRLGNAIFKPFSGDDGGYSGVDDRGAQTLLEFPYSGRYDEKSMRWFMEADEAAAREFVEGKVVLVGLSSKFRKDDEPTPLQKAHRGLYIHASFIDQIFGSALGDGIGQTQTLSNWMENALILFAVIMGAILAADSRRFWRHLAILAALGTILFALAFVAFRFHWWVPPFAPLLGLSFSFFGATLAARRLEGIEAGLVLEQKDILGRMFGEKKVDLIMRAKEEILATGGVAPREAVVTILMTDLKGFSRISERLDRSGGPMLITWLDQYMKEMEFAIYSHGGILKSTSGDAVYAVFGLDDPNCSAEKQRSDAIHCALEMRERLHDLNRRYRQQNLPEAAMRVGINTGRVSHGSIGTAEHMDYDIVGDSVNTAARLESFEKETVPEEEICRILASESTMGPVIDKFVVRTRGKISVSGKTEKIDTFEVLSAKNAD